MIKHASLLFPLFAIFHLKEAQKGLCNPDTPTCFPFCANAP